MSLHKLTIKVEDGGLYVPPLLCPDEGCDPVACCARCGLSIEDREPGDEPCADCPGPANAGDCWLSTWDDLHEYLEGEIVVEVEAEWDGDAPKLTIVRSADGGTHA